MSENRGKNRPARRVDADGQLQVGPNWDTLIERQIREAVADGKFDNLPLQGRPLPNRDNPYARDQALAFDMLRNAGAAPPWIEADKEVRELTARRDAIFTRAASGRAPSVVTRRRDRSDLEALVGRINGAIARVNAEAPEAVRRRTPLRLADELQRYDDACLRP